MRTSRSDAALAAGGQEPASARPVGHRVTTPTSVLRLGWARADITPPVGIYHRLWGAARHREATGIHRPLVADVLVLGPLSGEGLPLVRAQLDLCGLPRDQYDQLSHGLAEALGLPLEQVVLTFSHTHAAGWLSVEEAPSAARDLMAAYLREVADRLQEAGQQALRGVREAVLTYGTGRCGLAANRDFWDGQRHVCGFNPDGPVDDTVTVVRVTEPEGALRLTLVSYGCHPTTLAWQNTLVSPDYVGALREQVERATGVPCVFLLGACGEAGPRYGFVGDPGIADRNGRQLAHAALSVLEGMAPPQRDLQYRGPVVSGATLGIWEYVPLDAERRRQVALFAGGRYQVAMPLKPKPDPVRLQVELQAWQARAREAESRGDALAARDAGAYAERLRRWLGRLAAWPEGGSYPFHFTVYRLGDALWITTGGEPYQLVQLALRERFSDFTLLFSPLAGDLEVGYLLPAGLYGQGLYQEEPSILAPGCLERLVNAVAARVTALTEVRPRTG